MTLSVISGLAQTLRPLYPSPERKYNPSQPRVPAGNTGGGQWTSGGGSGGSAGASPMGNIDFGGLPSFSDLFALFQIAPSETDNSGYIQLAGDISAGDRPEIPSGGPPEIPQHMPKTSAERTGFMRAAANWLGQNSGLAGDVYVTAISNVEWLK